MTWNIVSDSSCDLPMNSFTSDRVHFEIVPLRIQVGSREFVDNDELEVPDLLAAMADEKSASSTACPQPLPAHLNQGIKPSALRSLQTFPVRITLR